VCVSYGRCGGLLWRFGGVGLIEEREGFLMVGRIILLC
jgi:hypothetical protein